MSEGNTREVVPVTPTAPASDSPLALFGAVFGRDQGGELASFDTRTVEGRQLLQKCEEEPDKKVKEMANLKLKLRHVYAQRIELTRPETGESVPALRICLITTDGQVHPCVSEGVRQSIWRLIRGHGLPPWKAGIPVTVSLKTLGPQRQWLTLLEDFDTPKGGRP